MQIHYLEIVTPDVDAICTTYAQIHGLSFSDGDANLGGARTAKLANGGLLGVRAPLRATEGPVVRPYVLVEDIAASVAAAADAGAMVALPPMEIAGHGTCAIVIQGGPLSSRAGHCHPGRDRIRPLATLSITAHYVRG